MAPHVKPKIARGPGSPTFRTAIGVIGGLYILMIFLGSGGSTIPRDTLPRPLLFFTQIACLFPRAATHSIEYRAAGIPCDRSGEFDLDTRPYFPMRPDDKENRFHRLGHFHRRSAVVMQALDEHLVTEHNAREGRGASEDEHRLIGGIALLSLRIPLPEPGDEVPRYRSVSYHDVPEDWRKYWYRTPRADVEARCAELER